MEETKNVQETPEAAPLDAPTEEADEFKQELESDDVELTDELSDEDLEQLYADSFQSFTEGELVKGKVIALNENTAVIDIGYKSEGLVDVQEFRDVDGSVELKIGDQVEVLLEATENVEGQLVLSKEKAEKMKVWDEIEEAFNDNEIIEGRVIDRIKGGLAVDVGVRAFLPGSQVDVRPVRNLESFKGEKIRVKVIKLNKRRGNIVLSRKEVIEAENFDRRQETIKALVKGNVITGAVKNITEYGAFIDLGGIDGLLHITDMSWGRINHPSELFNVGDDVEVVVLKYDSDTDRVSLGYKQKSPDPWEKAEEKYPANARVSGKIVSITDYGAFIELEEGVEGLIHVSEMSWSKRVKHPSKLVNVGDDVEAVVLDMDTGSRRISLGLKQIEPNPWVLVKERYRENEVIKGKVRNITDFGAFVEIDEGIDGLIHVSDMSWSKRIKHPSEVLKKGDEIEATVLNIDVDNQRLSLSLKQMASDAYNAFYSTHKVGDVLEVVISRPTNFGVFVELGIDDVEGLIHASELEIDKNANPEDIYKEGEKLTAKIIRIDREEHKIALSVRAIHEAEERATKETFMKKKTSSKATLGDVFGSLLQQPENGEDEKAEEETPVEASAEVAETEEAPVEAAAETEEAEAPEAEKAEEAKTAEADVEKAEEEAEDAKAEESDGEEDEASSEDKK